MRKNQLATLLIGFSIMFIGCTSGRTLVMNVPTERIKAVSANVIEDQATVSVPPEVSNIFRQKLENALFVGEQGSSPAFTKGTDLTIRYRFIQFTAGSQFKRWLAGGIGGYGEGVMTVEAKFFNSTGKELSKIQSEGKIGAGFFGGSIDGAVGECVKEVAQYTQQNFR